MTEYILAKSEAEYSAAATLFREYAHWLAIDLSFQHFNEELHELKKMYTAPHGGIILCKNNNEYIACVAIRKITGEIAELKRMFVQPAYQGKGTGRQLMEKAIELARQCGYTCIRLDTLNHMTAAISLYKNYGFSEIGPYYNNPNTTAVYFELKIKT